MSEPRSSKTSDGESNGLLPGSSAGLGRDVMLVDQRVIEECAEDRANDGRHHRHPPPSATGGEDAGSPSGHEREEPRTEITRGVDRVAGVESERDANRNDE